LSRDRRDVRIDAAIAIALGVCAFAVYHATAPAQPNLDGIGYLKRDGYLGHNFAAGHLLYMPLLRLAVHLGHGHALEAGQRLDAVLAALALALSYACARAFAGRAAAALATAGLLFSYGVWVQGADVESYALSLLAFAMLLALLLAWRALGAEAPSLEATLAVGLALGIAVLTHLTHVLAVPFVASWMIAHARSRRAGALHAALALAVGGALPIACYAYAGFVVRGTDGRGLVDWIATAQHGFRYQGTLLGRAADSVYGLSRALVWSPYLAESNAQALLGQFLLGLGAAAALLLAIRSAHREGRLARVPLALLGALVLPYALMALAFFGADHERWLFVLPPLWIAGAAALAGSARGLAAGVVLVAAMAWSNYAGAIGPAVDYTWDRTRADAATEPMKDGDLVIFPGHSWDEYIGFHSGRRVVRLPLAYYAGVLGKEGARARVERDVRGAWARGARVWLARFIEAKPDEPGMFELAQLGFPQDEQRGLWARWNAELVDTSEPSVKVVLLRERPRLPSPAPRVTREK
jgi:hypothetical protein